MTNHTPKKTLWTFVLYIIILSATTLHAHQPGTSSLILKLSEGGLVSGEYHVSEVDYQTLSFQLEDRFKRTHDTPFVANLHGAEALAWMSLASDGNPVTFATTEIKRVQTEDGPDIIVPFSFDPAGGKEITVTFSSFFEFDPRHKVVGSLEREGDTKVGLISLDDSSWTVGLETPSALNQFLIFTWEGVWHIWIGIDHIIFLIALLLPAVLKFTEGKYRPVDSFREGFFNVLKVVTAFTIAHSVTLSLAALQIVTLPSKWVESVIALSVVLAALNNIFPIVKDRAWMVAFGFGLIHGFGFANVLADLSLPTGTLAIALLSFNVGVEIGQLAIVMVFFPIAFYLRSHSLYQPIKLKFGSAVIALIATLWIVDRVFELEFMPF